MNRFESVTGGVIGRSAWLSDGGKRLAAYNPLMWLMALLLAALVAGCGGGGGGDPILGAGGAALGASGVAPGVAPTVTATAPLAKTPIVTGVAINSKVTATFSKDMAPATITAAGSFTLACPAGTAIAGTVTYVAASRVATFAPAANLPANTTCTATVATAAQDTTGLALAAPFVWTFTTAVTPDTTRPTVTLTVPAAGAAGVATNTAITATFSEAMDPTTITGTSFTVTNTTLGTAVAGNVTYAVGANTATFTPTTPTTLPAGNLFTATITIAATDLAGNALAGGNAIPLVANPYVWTFTTAAAADTIPPTVTLVNPANLSTGICLQKTVNATFSEAMAPLTVAGTTNFTLQTTAGPGPLLGGVVTYDALGMIATFTPTSPLAANTNYTATVTTGVKDLAGNAMASNKVWSFATSAQACSPVSPIALGTAAPFGNLGGTAGSTSAGTLTVIGGDLGSTATATSSITGFHDSANDIYTETPANIGAVNGKIYTCTTSTTGPTSVAVNATSCGIATTARNDATTTYNTLAGLPGGTDPGAGQLGGLVLAPGVYKAAAGSFLLTGADLTLDGQGDVNAVWVFQMATTLTVGAAGAPRSVILINGAQSKNVFWQVGSSATINGAGGGTMVGTILASAAVSFSTAGNTAITTLNGRAAGLNASVTMVNTHINVPAP